MNTHRLTRTNPITQALVDLQKAVPESKIGYDGPESNALPLCTIDMKRQVISMPDQPGYDLWVLRRNPKPGEMAVTCDDFGVPIEQAIAFLRGLPMKEVRAIAPESDLNELNKTLFKESVAFLKSQLH
jgi:hypothetical protein